MNVNLKKKLIEIVLKRFNISKMDFETFNNQMKQVYKYLFKKTNKNVETVQLTDKSKNFILTNEKILNFLKFGIDVIFSKTSESHIFKNRYVKYKQIMMSTFSYTFKVLQTTYTNNIQCEDKLSKNKRYVCAKQIKNNKTYIDQSMYEILVMQFLKKKGDPRNSRFLEILDSFYLNVLKLIIS